MIDKALIDLLFNTKPPFDIFASLYSYGNARGSAPGE
jgi:hypothetical protein